MFILVQNLEVKDTVQKIKKTKSEIKNKTKHEDLIANGSRNENTDIQEKTENCTNEKDAAKVI